MSSQALVTVSQQRWSVWKRCVLSLSQFEPQCNNTYRWWGVTGVQLDMDSRMLQGQTANNIYLYTIRPIFVAAPLSASTSPPFYVKHGYGCFATVVCNQHSASITWLRIDPEALREYPNRDPPLKRTREILLEQTVTSSVHKITT